MLTNRIKNPIKNSVKNPLANSKKGGVTIYIIIGIIILLVAVTAIAYSENIRRFYLESRNPEVKDVRLFVEQCLQRQTQEAVQIASLQGGYIDIPSVLENKGSYLPPPSILEPPFKAPYWWDNGVSYVPSEERVELELSNYISENIKSCLTFENIEQFSALNIEIESEPIAKVKLSSNSVSSRLELPLKITIDDKEIKLKSFSKETKSSFTKLYNAAKEVMDVENEKAFLESLTMDMIASSNGAGDSPHLPLDGYEVRCGQGDKWSKQIHIIPTVQNLVKYNFHFLSFEGMKKDYDVNYEDNREINQEVCVKESDGICTDYVSQKGNIFDYYTKGDREDGSPGYLQNIDPKYLSSSDLSDIKVKVEYDDSFPMNLDVTPSRGDTVKGFNLDIPIIGSCFKIYHHFYTINYPVLFQLTDEGEEDAGSNGVAGKLTFAFATGVNIENNQPKRTVSPYSAGDFIYSPNSEQYCENRLYPQDVFVKDKVTSQLIDSAKISYQCVRFNCDLGSTSSPKLNGAPIPGSPVLRTGFPSCVNGFLVVEKEGYEDSVSQVTIDSATQNLPVVELTPMKEIELRVIVVEKSGSNGNVLSLRDLKDDESVLVSISKSDNSHDDIAVYKNNLDNAFMDKLDFILEDGTYQFDAKLIKDNVGEQGLIGGLFIDSWQVTRQDLSSAKLIKVYVLAPSGIKDTDGYVNAWQNEIVPQSADYAPIFE